MLQLPVQTSMHGDQIGPSPRAYHMWFYISKQIDSRISASRDLTELMELHRAAGRFSHINHASLLMKVASLRREATTLPLTTASGTILDHPTLSSTNIQTGTASTPDSATQVASPSTPALEDGNTSYPAIPAQLKQQSASASLSSPSLSSSSGSGRVFSTIAPLAPRASISSSSPSSTPSDAQDVEIRKVPLFLGRICHKVQKMSKWFEPKHAALIVTSLSHLTHPASPSSLSSDGNLSSSWPSTWGVDRQLSLTVIDHVLLKASKRVRDESFTKDLAFVASVGQTPLGHPSSVSNTSLILTLCYLCIGSDEARACLSA